MDEGCLGVAMAGLLEFQSTSIIADGRRCCCRAHQDPPNSFNPRPSLLMDEGLRHLAIHAAADVFQSTSIIADGRRVWLSRNSMWQFCFNPRPSLLMDEGSIDRQLRAIQVVSIHVHHC